MIIILYRYAEVSELADEQDSGSCERYAREGSSPFFRIADERSLRDKASFFCPFTIQKHRFFY